jgi:hypothetical protein
MSFHGARWIRRIAAVLFPLLLAGAAGAADEPEKKRDERRPEKRDQRRVEERKAPPQQRSQEAAPSQTPQRPAVQERRRVEPPQQQPKVQPQVSRPPRSEPAAPRIERRTPPSAIHNPPAERRVERRPPPARNVEVIRNPSGDRHVTRTSAGTRTVRMDRPGRTVVSYSSSRGYVQRPVVISNRTYVQRTYVTNNVVVSRVYRPYTYRSVTFAVYTPVRYYPSPFYAWTYSPWTRPVRYTWGWYNDPWYGYYRGYFAPYPVYTSPTLWLTDYLIATTLQAAYTERMAERRAAADYAYASGTQLSPEVKQAIATEVQQQIEYQRRLAGNDSGTATADGLPPTLTDNRDHLFVVDRPLDVPNVSMGGQTCSISEGDVLQMNGPASGDSDAASVMVVSSKPGSCGRGSAVSVYLADLSEMQNRLRETVDQGLEELRNKQGQDGLPRLPANAASAPTSASFVSQLPPPDANATNDIQQQYTESSVPQPPQPEPSAAQPAQPAPGSGGIVPVYGGPAPTVTITIGQTVEQVVAALGEPKSVADLGSKKVYVFKDLKVTFIDGRVADVQ